MGLSDSEVSKIGCYHPLRRYYKPDNPSVGIVRGESEHDSLNGIEVGGTYYAAFQRIPCGKCIGCRLDYSRQWADRCMLELQYHKSAYFLTLTYDDDHVPESIMCDSSTGELIDEEIICNYTLRKKDLQDFFKRLRHHFPTCHIRYFAAGEYGGQTLRPHYHAIVFGLELTDLVFYKRSALGHNYFHSERLTNDVWKQGDVIVAGVTWETCAYTARYVTKKLKGQEAAVYDEWNVEPPFVLMSRKPGIARQYFDDHPDLMKYDYVNISTDEGGRKIKPSRYFKKLSEELDPEGSEVRKQQSSKFAAEIQRLKLRQTSLSYSEMLEVEEQRKINSTKILGRSNI